MLQKNNLQVETLTIGQLETNCYIAYCKQTNECIVIDPADSGDFITQTILDLKLTPLCILFTHAHFDHVLGSLELKLNFDIPIFMNQKDTQLLKKAQSSGKYWLKQEVDPVPQETKPLSEGSLIQIGKSSLVVYETPGHTPGSIVLFANEPQPLLFTGDTLFKAGVGRTDFEYSSPRDLQKSIQKLFATLPPETICYPGHGETTTLLEENNLNYD
ncbi:MAG: MBL fold hydrolase [Patescibacteria group bacterium]|nr:MAG: MBL fold hydrolase [Patescibacteria group bacterium]